MAADAEHSNRTATMMTMGRSRKSAVEVSPTAEAILLAAEEAFHARGFHGTTVRDISDMVGIQPGAIYNHFPGKEAILFRIVDTGVRELYDLNLEATNGGADVDSRLRAFVRCHVEFHGANQQKTLVIDRELAALSDAHRRTVIRNRRAYEDILFDIIESGVEEGRFQTYDSRVTVYAILGMATEVAVWYKPTGRLPLSEVANAYADMASALLAAR